MMTTVPAMLRHAVIDEEGGPEWLASLGDLVERAMRRWHLTLGEPFETGMAAWTAPASTTSGTDVVLKLSFPHDESRDEAAALAEWKGLGAVELLGADSADQALLLRRLRPGSTLQDAALPVDRHLAIGADVLQQMASVRVPSGKAFRDLAEVAMALATTTDELIERLLPNAPYRVDAGLCRHASDLLRTLPSQCAAGQRGLAHGDLNPGNILRSAAPSAAVDDGSGAWIAIDPKPVYGDLAWDPWPLLTQVDDWLATTPSAAVLAARTRVVADRTGLDAARIASWCTARSLVSGLWAADRGWWTGFRGADGDLDRAAAWARAAAVLGS